MAQRVKRLPTMQETWVRSLGQEDPLEKAMAPHSSTLAWRISWTEKPGAVILEPKSIKSVTVSTGSPSICHQMREPDAMIFVF